MSTPFLEKWGGLSYYPKRTVVEEDVVFGIFYLDTHWMVGLEVFFYLFKFFLPSFVTRDHDIGFHIFWRRKTNLTLLL